jgi:hypothetical protein
MKTTDYISNTIDRLPKGYVFTYTDFTTEVNKKIPVHQIDFDEVALAITG